MKEYKIPEGGLEVLLLALQVFEKYGFKYPSIRFASDTVCLTPPLL